jgi:hypothetical protein
MKDTTFKLDALERLQQALPAARTVALENAGHWPHEEEPEHVISALRSFLPRSSNRLPADPEPLSDHLGYISIHAP